jgi:hypothetical protein
VDLFCADTFELAHHCRRVVVRHYVMRANGNEVTSTQRSFWAFGEMALRDFFNDCLRHDQILWKPLFAASQPGSKYLISSSTPVTKPASK